MLHAAFRSFRIRLLTAATLLATLCPEIAVAQLSGNIAEKPIAIGYMRNVTPKRAIEYALNLTERLEIGTTMRQEMSQEMVTT